MNRLQTAVASGAPRLLQAFELIHHSVIPAALGIKRAYDTRSKNESFSETAKRAVKGAATPVAIGTGFLGLMTLLERRGGHQLLDARFAKGWINGHDLLHVGGGAALGFFSGLLEAAYPERFAHRHEHHHHHPDETGDHAKSSKASRALKVGLDHAWKHLLLDAALVAISKGLIAASGGDARGAHPHFHAHGSGRALKH